MQFGRLYNLEPFTFCKSRTGKKYIFLKADEEHAIYFMEDARGNFVQKTFLTSTKQNAYVETYDQTKKDVQNLLQATYLNEEASEFQKEGVDWLLNYYGSDVKKLKIAKDIREAKEKILEDEFLEEIRSDHDIKSAEQKIQNVSPRVQEIISKRIERGNISFLIKKFYRYECKVCKALGLYPYSFKKKNGNFYIETHHIVHVASLQKGVLGVANLITLCANHHRQFHYGDIEVIENTKEQLILKIDGQVVTIAKENVDNI